MASIYNLKPAFQNLLRPVARGIAGFGVTANQVTLAACVLSIFYGFAFYITDADFYLLVGLPVFLFIRMAMNAIDGMLAREFNQKSDIGFYLNELTDIISDVALYYPFVIVTGIIEPLLIIAIFLMIVSEVTGILALGLNKDRRYDGPFGKSDRAFAFGSLALALAFFSVSSIILNSVVPIFIVLTLITIFNRMRKGLTL